MLSIKKLVSSKNEKLLPELVEFKEKLLNTEHLTITDKELKENTYIDYTNPFIKTRALIVSEAVKLGVNILLGLHSNDMDKLFMEDMFINSGKINDADMRLKEASIDIVRLDEVEGRVNLDDEEPFRAAIRRLLGVNKGTTIKELSGLLIDVVWYVNLINTGYLPGVIYLVTPSSPENKFLVNEVEVLLTSFAEVFIKEYLKGDYKFHVAQPLTKTIKEGDAEETIVAGFDYIIEKDNEVIGFKTTVRMDREKEKLNDLQNLYASYLLTEDHKITKLGMYYIRHGFINEIGDLDVKK